MNLVALARDSMLAENTSREQKEKTSFWASDVEKNAFDIYHRFIGTKPTNPFDAKSLWRFKCGELAEEGLVHFLDKQGIVEKAGEDQLHVEFEWNSIRISGYADIVLKSGEVCEVKSYYGEYNAKYLLAGKPKTNYLKQLAVYMYALKIPTGILYMVPMPMGEHYQFQLEQIAEGIFRCNDLEFDLTDEFARWEQLYKEHVIPKIEPKSEFVYKYPVATLDWKKVSKSQIGLARNGHKVIGSWQAIYSPYLGLIIAQEGAERGYTLAEIEIIKQKTTGYSTW